MLCELDLSNQYATYLYSFEMSMDRNINLELELIINTASSLGVPTLFEAITVAFHNMLLKIFFYLIK